MARIHSFPWLEYYLAMKKNGILLFVTIWIDLEGIILSEMDQKKPNNVSFPLYVESKKVNK